MREKYLLPACTIISLLALFPLSCLGTAAGQEKGMKTERPIEQVLKAHTPSLISMPGVVGTAQGLCKGKPCIKVFVRKLTPELEGQIPKSLEGYPVRLEETGGIFALPEDD